VRNGRASREKKRRGRSCCFPLGCKFEGTTVLIRMMLIAKGKRSPAEGKRGSIKKRGCGLRESSSSRGGDTTLKAGLYAFHCERRRGRKGRSSGYYDA